MIHLVVMRQNQGEKREEDDADWNVWPPQDGTPVRTVCDQMTTHNERFHSKPEDICLACNHIHINAHLRAMDLRDRRFHDDYE